MELIALFVAILTWIIPSDKLYDFFKKITPKSISILEQKQKNKIDSIFKYGLLTSSDRVLLSDVAHLAKNKYVYWPVTPTATPNIIHKTFINYTKILTGFGLKINVLVFDKYYMIMKNNSAASLSEVKQFVNTLKFMGLPTNCKILYESKQSKKRLNFQSFLGLSQQLFVSDMININQSKKYISESNITSYIRYTKPILNMIYLSTSSKKYSFTLSGADEQILWDAFSRTNLYNRYRLINLYIPIMNGLMGAKSEALDRDYNVTFSDSLEDIENKLNQYSQKIDSMTLNQREIENSFIFYLLHHLKFVKNEGITVKLLNNTDKREYKNCLMLYNDFKDKLIDYNDLADCIYSLIHTK